MSGISLIDKITNILGWRLGTANAYRDKNNNIVYIADNYGNNRALDVYKFDPFNDLNYTFFVVGELMKQTNYCIDLNISKVNNIWSATLIRFDISPKSGKGKHASLGDAICLAIIDLYK